MNEYNYDQIYNPDSKKIKLLAYGLHLSLYEIERSVDISDFKLITVMRNPVDRILSEHKYCIGKHKGNQAILIAHRLPPIGDPIETASNVVCKMLSRLNDQDNLISIETHLMHAKKTLEENFFFVGITENLEESIPLLYSQLGWEIPEEIPHLNQTNEKDQFSDEIIEGITKRNWADIELYEYALALHDQQKSRLATYPLRNEINNFTDGFDYTFDKKLQGSGWGIREIDKGSKAIYRWATENNEASIKFNLIPAVYSFQCSILIQPILFQQFTISVNDVPLDLKTDIKDVNSTLYEWITCTGVISKNYFNQSEKTRVTFNMTPPETSNLSQFYKEDNQQQNILANYIRGKFACQRIVFNKN